MTKEKNNVNAVAKVEKNVTDVVLNKVTGFAQRGELVLPDDYSAENALKSAWLALQSVEVKDGRKALDVCTKASIANSLLDMVVQGLSPAKKQCYFIPYGKELTLSRSYMGTVAVARRFGGIKDIRAQVVYQNDDFEYEIDPMTSDIKITRHAQKLENIDIAKIKAVYAVVLTSDDKYYVELMTMDQVRKAWGQGATKGNSPAHKNFAEEMAKKTVINRACKLFVNTSSDSAILTSAFNRVTENDYREDDGAVVVDVEEADIKEVKDAAEAVLFGVRDGESAEVEETVDETPKQAEIEEETAEMPTPFDDPYIDDGQISMEEVNE